MHDVIDTVRILGDFILDPFEEKALGNSVDGRHRMMAAGFRAIVDFPRPLEVMLSEVYRDRPHRLQRSGPMHSGEFRVWLATGSETHMKKSIRRVIRRWTARSANEIAADDIPFGYFTLRQAGHLCGYEPEALRVVLKLKRPKAWAAYVDVPRIDPETMAWLVKHVGGRIEECGLATALDVVFRELSPLRRSGLIETFVQTTGAIYGFFSPVEADRLVRKLLKRFDGGASATKRSLALPIADRELDVPAAELVVAVLDGRLAVVGTSPEARGLSRIHVDIDAAAGLNLPRWED
jgi:hypothetical protein